MNQGVINEGRRQIGIYFKDILSQRGITRSALALKAGISREQVKWVMEGERDITLSTFFKIINALDCYFYLADREGKHLDSEDMIKKSSPDKAMDFGVKS